MTSNNHDLIRQGRKAAHVAARRYQLTVTPRDLEDMAQTASLTFWRLLDDGRPLPYAFAAAREEARRCWHRQILGRWPRVRVSLEQPLAAGDAQLIEYLTVPEHRCSSPSLRTATDPERVRRLAWLGNDALEALLIEGRLAAGVRPGHIACNAPTIQREIAIIRLAACGHTNAAIAHALGTTEGTIRNRRTRIRRWLRASLPPGISPDDIAYNRAGGDPARANEIRLTYRNYQKPKEAAA